MDFFHQMLLRLQMITEPLLFVSKFLNNNNILFGTQPAITSVFQELFVLLKRRRLSSKSQMTKKDSAPPRVFLYIYFST